MKKWKIKQRDDKLVKKLAKEADLSEILISLLIQKGITTRRDVEKFIRPRVSDLHNPFLFNDMAKAVERIKSAIQDEEKILIYGDRDVDGISSVNLAVLYLKSLNINVDWYIPSDEGYGLHKNLIEKYSQAGVKLIITVDCGISASEEIALAETLGMDVIITDHHEPPVNLPDAFAIIDPKCPGENYPFKELAGCGVAFKLFQSLAFSFSEYFNKDIVVLDIETTGLSSYMDEIVEIGAVKMKNFVNVDKFSTLVKPAGHIPADVSDIHGITDEMCCNAPAISEVMNDFLDFAGNSVIVAHNAGFDMAFLHRAAKKIEREINNPVVDTLELSRSLFNAKSHRLSSLAEEFNIEAEKYHRALDDAATTAKIFERIVLLQEKKQRHFIENYLYLTALGTVADIVPLVSENRVFVKYGLPLLYNSGKPGIRALIDGLEIEKKSFTAKKVSWSVCPLLNAAGRCGNADIAVQLLLTDDQKEAQNMLDEIMLLNSERKKIQKVNIGGFLEATARQNDIENDKIFVTVAEGLKHGVTGIAASEIVKRFNKPVILLILEGEEAMGAARSVEGVDIVSIIEKCKDILIKYGGHKAAAGLTIAKINIDEFKKRIKFLAASLINEETLCPKISVDGVLSIEDISIGLIKELELLEPCGAGNSFPVFVINDVILSDFSGVGANGSHLKAFFQNKSGDVSGIGWQMGGLVDNFKRGEKVDVAFQLELNVWQSKESAQLMILDIKKSAGEIV